MIIENEITLKLDITQIQLPACHQYNKNNILQMDTYEQTMKQSHQLAMRMRMGTGAANLLGAQQSETHYIDTLERFQKDFASYDKMKRQEQKQRKQQELQRKRIEQLQRQNRRWQMMQDYDRKLKSRQEQNVLRQNLGTRRTANSNSLAYNPINLEYDRNLEGQKLKMRDQDSKIRSYVRAHNMDSKGNCKFNLLNGEDRVGIEQVVPQDLRERYEHKLSEHYDNQRLKIPASSNSIRSNKMF